MVQAMKRAVWMKVTEDEYELPIAVADNSNLKAEHDLGAWLAMRDSCNKETFNKIL